MFCFLRSSVVLLDVAMPEDRIVLGGLPRFARFR
jgi:hypothetical protein